MEVYVIAVYSLDELKKHARFKTECFPLTITKKTDEEFGKNSFPVAIPASLWKELKDKNDAEQEALGNDQYDPYENNFDDGFDRL